MHNSLSFFPLRLLDVIYSEKKLYLVFEYLSQDLKRYIDTAPSGGLSTRLVKVIVPVMIYLICHSPELCGIKNIP